MNEYLPQLASGALGRLGLFEIPGYSRYLIDTNGMVFNKETKQVLKGSVNPAGYTNIRLTNDEGVVLTWGLHRLLGYVFKRPERDIADLVINHIDAIKGNNELENLEWTTYQGNLEHAGLLGLTTKCLPVSVRDVDTGEVTEYPSATACARVLGITKDAVLHRLKSGANRVFPERKQYRVHNSTTPWPVPQNVDRALLLNGRSRPAQLRYVLTRTEMQFDQLQQLAEHLGASMGTLSQWINYPGQPVLPGFIQLKWTHDDSPWREVSDPYIEHDRFAGTRSVKVTHAKTGEVRVFVSGVECAKVMGLKPNALNYRLKADGQQVFSDGYKYSYYSKSFNNNSPMAQ